ncbi:MAG: class I SAM-dependent methyltransferase [Gammaproteobacteria bacterium]|nr:class I SAM-dependent methyltransferase [Gammaproteobacteria bacterium]MDH3767906.1 class I SAM-dependent methyltransferase [Gammaproteobacteria bacterium]
MTTERDYWERHARNYDASMRLLGGPLPRMLELASAAVRDKQVLEVAAGTGIVTTAIAQTASNIVATDYAAAMVKKLEHRVRDARLANVRCEQADIYELRFAPDTFDVVVAANVLHLVPDLGRAIASIQRVLKPAGLLVAPTFCHDETKTAWLLSQLIALSGFPGHRRFTARSLTDTLQHQGLRIQRSETLSGLIPIGYVEGAF